MNRSCNELRDRLTATNGAELPDRLSGHLESCPSCARFAERLGIARRILRDRAAEMAPDGGFAARVLERLDHERNDVLGWAAVRLLPATVVLLVVLAWVSLQVAPGPSALDAQSPTEDLLSWVLELDEEGS